MKALAWMARNIRSQATVAASSRPRPRARMLVAERGVEAIGHALSDDVEWEETVVVCQPEAEPEVSLPQGVVSRIAQMEQRGLVLGRAVLLVSSGHDSQTLAVRELVARSLLEHLSLAAVGELVVVAHDASEALRDELLGLVGKLLGEVESQKVPIRLQFRAAAPVRAAAPEAPPKSGVRMARPAGRTQL